MTATEVARNFSAALNRVAAGEKIEILRNGVTVALLGPPKRRLITVERFRELPHPSTATSLPTSVDPCRCRAAGGPLAVRIDTDLIVEAERGALVRLEDILGEEERAISVITVSELLHGVHRARGRRRARRRAFVERSSRPSTLFRSRRRLPACMPKCGAELSRRGDRVLTPTG